MPRFLIPVLVALATAALDSTAQTTAIVNATVVDVRAGRLVPRTTILVTNGRIAAIGQTDSLAIPARARRIDAAGAYLIPGLADMHAHFARPEDFQMFISYGVTLVQYLNASPEMLEWRDSIAAGRMLGPDVHPCFGAISSVDSISQARQVLANAKADGFDCIKPYDRISDVAFSTLTGEGRAMGLRSVAHIPRNLTWQSALRARPSAIAHAEEFLYSPIPSRAARDSLISAMHDGDIAMVTTIANYAMITRQGVELQELLRMPELADYSPVHQRLWAPRWNHYARDFTTVKIPRMRQNLNVQRQLVKSMDSAGVRILVGTDEGNFFMLPGVGVHDELEALVLAGLTPVAALRAATIAPAEFLGLDREIGSIEVGKRADLVLLYGNPLADITTTRLIGGVMRNGQWVSRDSLRATADLLRAKFARERQFIEAVDRDGQARALRAAARQHYVPDQRALNELAYQFWRVQNDTASARAVFVANVRLHPNDWMAHGSLGEFLEFARDTTHAVIETQRALHQRPRDREMLTQLARLRPGGAH